jgi:hypothetical protein
MTMASDEDSPILSLVQLYELQEGDTNDTQQRHGGSKRSSSFTKQFPQQGTNTMKGEAIAMP